MFRNLVAVLSMLFISGPARADVDAMSPRATGVGESLRAAATGSLATTINPAGLALARSYVLEASYGYRATDHAHIQTASVCDSVTTRVAACLSYVHLSADPSVPGDFSLHEGGLTLAVIGITGALAAGRAGNLGAACPKSDCVKECPKEAPCPPCPFCPGC